MTDGIAARTLSDEDLRHELLQLKTKQADIEADGTAQQRANHASRTAELEAEFLARFGSGADGADDEADDSDGPDVESDRDSN